MIKIEAPSGIVGIWDESIRLPVASHDVKTLSAELKERAAAGDLFFVESEDPVKCVIEIMTLGELPVHLRRLFEPRGGAFRLRVPTGELQVDSLPPSNGSRITIDPGDYLLSPYSRAESLVSEYAQRIKAMVGDADWRFHQRVDKIGAVGCLSLVVLVVLLAIPITRQFWWAILLLPTLFYLAYFTLIKTPRYRRVEEVQKNFERDLAHYVILLRKSDSASDVPGGWIKGM